MLNEHISIYALKNCWNQLTQHVLCEIKINMKLLFCFLSFFRFLIKRQFDVCVYIWVFSPWMICPSLFKSKFRSCEKKPINIMLLRNCYNDWNRTINNNNLIAKTLDRNALFMFRFFLFDGYYRWILKHYLCLTRKFILISVFKLR